MFIEASLRIYIIWIIPFINSPTSPFGALETRVINLWVSQEFPKGPPVDCSAGLYLLVVPMSLQLQAAWQFVKKKAALFYIVLHLSVCFPEQLQTAIYLHLNLTKRSFFFSLFFFYLSLEWRSKFLPDVTFLIGSLPTPQQKINHSVKFAANYRGLRPSELKSKGEPCLWRWKQDPQTEKSSAKIRLLRCEGVL